MTVLVTGVAGFIGFNVARALLAAGERVVGVDILNSYYDPALKQARLDVLTQEAHAGPFQFEKVDISDRAAMGQVFERHGPIRHVIHLAAQAGVRHSLAHPFDYVSANLVGHLVILEACRHHDSVQRLVYASSSSVYGGNTKMPLSVEDRVDTPISLYAATKRADELMSQSYAHLFGVRQIGLRFFTVYGPWGRPDMAMFKFTRAMLAGAPIDVFNHGDMRRDFTYIDDIVAGVLACLQAEVFEDDAPPHKVYNLGNSNPENLMDVIEELEAVLGVHATKNMLPIQPGDVPATYADIAASTRDLGFEPKTAMPDGVRKFVEWYRGYYNL